MLHIAILPLDVDRSFNIIHILLLRAARRQIPIRFFWHVYFAKHQASAVCRFKCKFVIQMLYLPHPHTSSVCSMHQVPTPAFMPLQALC